MTKLLIMPTLIINSRSVSIENAAAYQTVSSPSRTGPLGHVFSWLGCCSPGSITDHCKRLVWRVVLSLAFPLGSLDSTCHRGWAIGDDHVLFSLWRGRSGLTPFGLQCCSACYRCSYDGRLHRLLRIHSYALFSLGVTRFRA